MTPRFTLDMLRVSQHSLVDFGLANPYFACFSNMGFGKTAAGITLIEKLFRQGEARRVLIVTTLLVAQNTWPIEIRDWAHTSYLKFKVIEGDASNRLAAARGPEQIHLINQENFVWLAQRAGRAWPYDTVIFDDAEGFKTAARKTRPNKAICAHDHDCPIYEHEKSRVCEHAELCPDYRHGAQGAGCIVICQDFKPVPSSLRACVTLCKIFKSPPAKYTRFGALCALMPQIRRLIHFTGTPSNRGLVDLWPLVFTLDGGRRLGRTYSQYKARYFNRSHNGFSWVLKPGAESEIHARIKDVCIAIESEAEAELPPCHHIDKAIDLPPEAAKMYDDFERDLYLNIEDEEITAANNGVLAGKLLQVCGGAVYTGNEKEWLALHDEKLNTLDDILARHKNEPVLVGYNFQHELERLKKRYPHGITIKDRRDFVHAWNAGEIPLGFTHPKSAGHGLNIQRGPGRTLVWLGLSWRLDHNRQLNKRLWRPGQGREVYIYYIIAKGRADVRLMEGVAKYGWTQDQLLNAVKRDVKNNCF